MFKEIWCTDPVLRIGTLERMVATRGDAIMLTYRTPPTTRRDNPVPTSALDRPRYDAPQTMVFSVDKIVNPQEITTDFRPNDQTDEIVDEFDARHNERLQYILRKVGTVQMPTGDVSLATVIEFQQRLGRFLSEYGWQPADPSIVLRDWCSLSGLQPVADMPAHYSSETPLTGRLGAALTSRGADLDGTDLRRISDWVKAASATQRSYDDTMTRLCRAVTAWQSFGQGTDPLVIAYLSVDTRNALTAWALRHRPEPVPQQTMEEAYFNINPANRDLPRPDVRIQGERISAAPPPANLGIIIPLNHPGRRAVNMEIPDEICETVDAPDRPDESGRGGAGVNAGSPRRTLRLDD